MILNRTNLEIIGFVYGFYFSLNSGDIFLKYIAPEILKTTTNLQIPSFITILSIILFLASFAGVIDIIRMIIKTHRISTKEKFWKYLFKAEIILLLSLISAEILKNSLIN